MALLRDALSAVSTTGERWYELELHRLTGELTLLSNDQSEEVRVKEAEACFLKALDIGRHQEVKSWELRAAMSLARLWQEQGKKTEARDLPSLSKYF